MLYYKIQWKGPIDQGLEINSPCTYLRVDNAWLPLLAKPEQQFYNYIIIFKYRKETNSTERIITNCFIYIYIYYFKRGIRTTFLIFDWEMVNFWLDTPLQDCVYFPSLFCISSSLKGLRPLASNFLLQIFYT